MNGKKLYFISLVIGVSFFSCKTDFQLGSFDREEQLVVFGRWSSNKLEVSLSKTSNNFLKLSPDTLRILDGEILLVDSTKHENYSLKHSSKGIYTLNLNPVIGHQYMIISKWKDKVAFSELQSLPHIPKSLALKSFMIERDPNSKFLINTKYNLSFIAPSDPTYIQFTFSKNKIFNGSDLGSISPTNYECKDASSIYPNTICVAGKEVSWEYNLDFLRNFYINYNTPDSGKSYLAEFGPDTGYFHLYVNILPEEIFKYYTSTFENEPFEKLFLPPTALYSNMHNGFGIFYIQSQIRDSLRIKE